MEAEGTRTKVDPVLIPGTGCLLHIQKFCAECQAVVMLRPRGRPGRLLAYFDDISGSAVSTGLPVALLPAGSRPGRFLLPSVSRAFALSALIAPRFVLLATVSTWPRIVSDGGR